MGAAHFACCVMQSDKSANCWLNPRLNTLSFCTLVATSAAIGRRFAAREHIERKSFRGRNKKERVSPALLVLFLRSLRSFAAKHPLAIRQFEQGIEKGLRSQAVLVLTKRFGAMSDHAMDKITVWPQASLSELVDQAYFTPSLDAFLNSPVPTSTMKSNAAS